MPGFVWTDKDMFRAVRIAGGLHGKTLHWKAAGEDGLHRAKSTRKFLSLRLAAEDHLQRFA